MLKRSSTDISMMHENPKQQLLKKKAYELLWIQNKKEREHHQQQKEWPFAKKEWTMQGFNIQKVILGA